MIALMIFFLKIFNLLRSLTGQYIYIGQYTTNRNLGDALNLIIVPYLFKRKVIPKRYSFEFMYNKSFNYQCIGSVLGDINSKSVVCGIGSISDNVIVSHEPVKIYGVRGPLTRELLMKQGIACPPLYGDPALLLPRMYKPIRPIKYKIGFIPHYADQGKLIVKKILSLPNVKFIDILLPKARWKPSIYGHWKSFVDSICECDIIVSSSLHGLILGDAYRKRTLWVKFGNDVLGNDFKFHDYYASMGMHVDPIALEEESDLDVLNRASYKPISNINLEHLLNINFLH